MDKKDKKISVSEGFKQYVANLPAGPEKEALLRFLSEADRLAALSEAERKNELSQADQNFELAQDKLNLLNMPEGERKAEVARRKAEAKRTSGEFEKELDELIAESAAILTDEDFARRKDEAEAMKKITGESVEELARDFNIFSGKGDLPGMGAVLKKAAEKEKLGEFLNYYGYRSDFLGLNQLVGEMIIGDREILSDRAFDNFLYQQKAFSLAQDLSCMAAAQNQWSLAFSVGRKGRVWRELEAKDHLAAVLWAIKKIEPEIAARYFGPEAYGYFNPGEKGASGGGGEFVLGEEGKIILMLNAANFEKSLARKNFNPEAAKFLASAEGELANLGLPGSFSAGLKKYLEERKNRPDEADEVWREIKK